MEPAAPPGHDSISEVWSLVDFANGLDDRELPPWRDDGASGLDWAIKPKYVDCVVEVPTVVEVPDVVVEVPERHYHKVTTYTPKMNVCEMPKVVEVPVVAVEEIVDFHVKREEIERTVPRVTILEKVNPVYVNMDKAETLQVHVDMPAPTVPVFHERHPVEVRERVMFVAGEATVLETREEIEELFDYQVTKEEVVLVPQTLQEPREETVIVQDIRIAPVDEHQVKEIPVEVTVTTTVRNIEYIPRFDGANPPSLMEQQVGFPKATVEPGVGVTNAMPCIDADEQDGEELMQELEEERKKEVELKEEGDRLLVWLAQLHEEEEQLRSKFAHAQRSNREVERVLNQRDKAVEVTVTPCQTGSALAAALENRNKGGVPCRLGLLRTVSTCASTSTGRSSSPIIEKGSACIDALENADDANHQCRPGTPGTLSTCASTSTHRSRSPMMEKACTSEDRAAADHVKELWTPSAALREGSPGRRWRSPHRERALGSRVEDCGARNRSEERTAPVKPLASCVPQSHGTSERASQPRALLEIRRPGICDRRSRNRSLGRRLPLKPFAGCMPPCHGTSTDAMQLVPTIGTLQSLACCSGNLSLEMKLDAAVHSASDNFNQPLGEEHQGNHHRSSPRQIDSHLPGDGLVQLQVIKESESQLPSRASLPAQIEENRSHSQQLEGVKGLCCGKEGQKHQSPTPQRQTDSDLSGHAIIKKSQCQLQSRPPRLPAQMEKGGSSAPQFDCCLDFNAKLKACIESACRSRSCSPGGRS